MNANRKVNRAAAAAMAAVIMVLASADVFAGGVVPGRIVDGPERMGPGVGANHESNLGLVEGRRIYVLGLLPGGPIRLPIFDFRDWRPGNYAPLQD